MKSNQQSAAELSEDEPGMTSTAFACHSDVSELSPVTSEATPLLSPAELKLKVRLSESVRLNIVRHRTRLQEAVLGGVRTPIVIVGPCSIHCETAALEYAERLARLQNRLGDKVLLVMRVYFEKPRTTIGWKGFLYDPDLDGSDDLQKGLERARALLVRIAGLDLPIATEILDPIAAEYLEDCISWVAIGARTSESQIHRQLASRLGCPVGFKNGTDGSVEVAAQAMQSAASPHTHLGIDDHGRVALRRSPGNSATHVVLRGGAQGPNYDAQSVAAVIGDLTQRGLTPRVLVDCSHGNSEKDHNRQPVVARAVMEQMKQPGHQVLGLMIESHLNAGKQPIDGALKYGVSVTDGCIDFATTEALLWEMANG